MPTALVLLAPGAEEMESVISIDILRRGGLTVTVAGVEGDNPVLCSRDVRIVPDTSLTTALASVPYDVIVLPGGVKGAKCLSESEEVGNALKEQEKRGGFIAAVCAATTALCAHGIGKGKKATSHPSVQANVSDFFNYLEDRVVTDGKLITSRGPGTCFEFALAIVQQIQGADKAESLIPPMLLKM